ncbi:MAG: hypothetical protein ACQEWV_22285, partial [Bacillota bacterium]
CSCALFSCARNVHQLESESLLFYFLLEKLVRLLVFINHLILLLFTILSYNLTLILLTILSFLLEGKENLAKEIYFEFE